jgi:hypothetical protein
MALYTNGLTPDCLINKVTLEKENFFQNKSLPHNKCNRIKGDLLWGLRQKRNIFR